MQLLEAEILTWQEKNLELAQKLTQITAEKEALHQEGLRLHQELQQQQIQLTAEFRVATFEQLQTLLTNYPSIHQMVSVKPELPAKNLLSMFTPLDNLLSKWGYELIGKPWEQVPYNSQLHQPDKADMTQGELVYIRFVGYQHQGKILCPAKVSRTLPGGR
ncbi:molecular chaperone GrpE [Nostoc piscinale CENA21]|uniref:Molecular chaperone GrpE n=1 Tax=Nostoc piscinale CENA21 TaxID=224013 RepID=A0A0M3V6X8_9NOSO|nr:molecular chaperone GrpE [Nostoc piscinale CENA21]